MERLASKQLKKVGLMDYQKVQIYDLVDKQWESEPFLVCTSCLMQWKNKRLPFKELEKVDTDHGCLICGDTHEQLNLSSNPLTMQLKEEVWKGNT